MTQEERSMEHTQQHDQELAQRELADQQDASAQYAGRFDDWPQEGGVDVQPWDAKTLGIDPTAEEPDMPVRPNHGMPILASGSGGPEVLELGQRLGELGYPSSVTRGENPFNVLDRSLEDAYAAFVRDYDVQEDPTGFGGDNPAGRALAAQHVGPWGWEALIRASDRARGAPEQPS